MLAIVGILGVMFIIPFVLALLTLIVYGEFALPQGAVSGVLTEIDPNIILGLLIAGLPLLLVWAVETNRRRGERTVGLTLGLLVALMLAATAVPFISYLRPLRGLPPRHALAILTVVALPLILIVLVALLLLPGLSSTDRGAPERRAGDRDSGPAA